MRELLKEHHLTQGQLRIILGCSPQAVSKYVNMERRLPLECAEKLGRKYGVRPEWLLGFDDMKTELEAEFEKAWESSILAEKLLLAIGFRFEKSEEVKKVQRWYISEETGERKSFAEDDVDDITAYKIILGKREVGQCSIREYEHLIDSIVDNAGKRVGDLIERSGNNG